MVKDWQRPARLDEAADEVAEENGPKKAVEWRALAMAAVVAMMARYLRRLAVTTEQRGISDVRT